MDPHEIAIRFGSALIFGSLIGFERQWRQRMAGLRTNALVVIGAAVFVIFSVMLSGNDSPTRVAAQIVSGIGFIGGGVIFVRRDAVRGLTTASGVWTTAAVGMAAGGDLPLLALATTLRVGVARRADCPDCGDA